LVAHRAIGTFLRSAAPIVLPVVLFLLGVTILFTSGAGAFLMQLVR
jgi:hypothetical protein